MIQFPIFIVCRDRLTPLMQLLAWLEKAGQKKIFLIDNDSAYPPLLQFYQTCPHRVIRVHENKGHLVAWDSGIVRSFAPDEPYVVTDPDIVPSEDCPLNALDHFRKILERRPEIKRVGFGLRIDDLPDRYQHKERVQSWERSFWTEVIEPGLFVAPIDTTFALYRARWGRSLCPSDAARTNAPYWARHTAWYADSAHPTEEDAFYSRRANPAVATWSQPYLPSWII